VTVPAVDGLLVEPYVTVPEFRAAPTYLDSDDLIPGGATTQQDDELYNVLIRASMWADNEAGQRLGAHTATEQRRARVDRYGRISLHAANKPVRAVTALSYGGDPANLTALSDLSGVWIEDGSQILTVLGGAAGYGVKLDFGTPRAGGELYVRPVYVAGYASTVLSSATSVGAISLPVTNPAGIYPGDTLRLWDPGFEEAVTVASGYTPGSATVTLTGALAKPHQAGAGLSGLPADAHQAVICYAVALLLRQDVASSEPFANAPYGPSARRAESGGQAGGLIDQAEQWIRPYKRVR
jgi:hypothetical protein